jgi:hypothetical protein
VGALAEGLGIRAVARVFEGAPNTVLQGWVAVADHAGACSPYGLHDVRVTQGQLDALCALLSAVNAGEGSDAAALHRLSRSPPWGWAAIDPVTKGLRTIAVGDRPLARAQRVVHQVVQGLAPGCVPLFLTDGFTAYTTALLTHSGPGGQPARWRAQGPTPQPRWVPLPGLLSAQGGKPVRRRRLVRVQHRVVFGTLEAVHQGLAAGGWQSTTACIARRNLAIRQQVAAIGRRVTTLCTHEDGVRQQVALSQVYHHCCLPQASLRVPWPQPRPPNGRGSAKPWRPRTPAMAAGLTDRGWPLREGRMFRVPPGPQPVGV